MLKTRMITAIILLAVLLPILFFLPAVYIGAFFLVAVLAGAWEWSRLLTPEATRAAWLYAIFCLAIIFVLLALQNVAWQFSLLLLAVIFWFFIAPFMLAKGMNLSLQKLRPFYVVLGLILLPATWFAIVFLDLKPALWTLCAILLAVWCFDQARLGGQSKLRRYLTLRTHLTLGAALGLGATAYLL